MMMMLAAAESAAAVLWLWHEQLLRRLALASVAAPFKKNSATLARPGGG